MMNSLSPSSEDITLQDFRNALAKYDQLIEAVSASKGGKNVLGPFSPPILIPKADESNSQSWPEDSCRARSLSLRGGPWLVRRGQYKQVDAAWGCAKLSRVEAVRITCLILGFTRAYSLFVDPPSSVPLAPGEQWGARQTWTILGPPSDLSVANMENFGQL